MKMKKSDIIKKLIEEVIEENLEEITNIQKRKQKNDPLDNEINNSDFLTQSGKIQVSLNMKHSRLDGGASQQKAINYLRKKGYDI
tara:strand:+ start:255 stop:509 length:255 start_codon:yes stop_codon:yes gene_type:complete